MAITYLPLQEKFLQFPKRIINDPHRKSNLLKSERISLHFVAVGLGDDTHTQGVVSVCVKKKMSQSICRLMSRDKEISEPDLSLGGLSPFFSSFFQG